MKIKKDQFAGEEEHDDRPDTDDGVEEGEVKELPTEPDPNEEPSGGSEEEKEARKERRAERGKLRQAAEAAEARAVELERQVNEANAKAVAAQESARMLALWQQNQGQNRPDPWQTAINNEVVAKRKALMLEHQSLVNENKYDAAAKERLLAEWNQTEQRQQEIITHKQLYIRDQQARQNQPDPQEAANVAAFNSRMQSDFPDIMADKRFVDHMTASYFKLLAENKPNTWETAALAAAETRRAFRLGTRPPPDAATKARYSGVGGSTNGGPSNGKIAMLPKYQRMAHARYPNLSEREAEKKWAATVGKKVLDGDSGEN